MAAFGSAALICHRGEFMLLQKGRIKRLGGAQAPPGTPSSRGLQWPEAPPQCQKYTYGNDKLLLVLPSQKIINNQVFTSPITTISSFSLIFTLAIPRVCKYIALSNSYGLRFPHLCGSCSRPAGFLVTGVQSPTPPLQLFTARDGPRKRILSSKIIAGCF